MKDNWRFLALGAGVFLAGLLCMLPGEKPEPKVDALTARVMRLEERIEALQEIHKLIGKPR